jgi:hypothetical protein
LDVYEVALWFDCPLYPVRQCSRTNRYRIPYPGQSDFGEKDPDRIDYPTAEIASRWFFVPALGDNGAKGLGLPSGTMIQSLPGLSKPQAIDLDRVFVADRRDPKTKRILLPTSSSKRE